MFGLDNKSGINVMPSIAPADSQTPLWFTEGGAGMSATYPGQDWFNQIQAELLNVLKAADIAPQKGNLTQLSSAISKLASAYAVSIVHTTGVSMTSVMSQSGATKTFADKTSLSEQEFKAPVVSPVFIAGSVNGGSLRMVFKDGKPYFSINIGELWYLLEVPFENAGFSTREPGDFELTGRRTSQLRKGYYSPNGDLFDLTSPQGKALNALSAEFKSDWGVTISGGKINLPNIKQSDGRTPFVRFVNDTARRPGSVEQDAMRNFTGSVEIRNYGRYPMIANNTGVFTFSSVSSDLYSVKEGASSDPMGTHRLTMDPARVISATNISNEFRALNIGMNLAFYLGV